MLQREGSHFLCTAALGGPLPCSLSITTSTASYQERALTWKISMLICLRDWSGGTRTVLLLPSHMMLPCRCAATVAHSSTVSMSSASVFLSVVLCKTTPSQNSTQGTHRGGVPVLAAVLGVQGELWAGLKCPRWNSSGLGRCRRCGIWG